MRVYCHEALHLKDKMQSAGAKVNVEKWDSDSDSDETDDEDLMVQRRGVSPCRGSVVDTSILRLFSPFHLILDTLDTNLSCRP